MEKPTPARSHSSLRWAVRPTLTLLGITLATFLLLQMLPGDAARVNLASGTDEPITQAAYDDMIHRLGLDRPWYQQYFVWMKGVLSADLGDSFADQRPVIVRIGERLPATLLLNTLALSVAVLLALPLGIAAARRPGGPLDRGSRWLLFLLFALPGFWAAVLLQGLFAVRLGWLPLQGMTGIGLESAGWAARALDRILHLILPVTCLAYGQLAFLARFTRANVLECMGEEFIRTARAKGLPERLVLRRHAFRRALSPLLTLSGLTLPALVGGSILIETIFSWPGVGSLFFESVTRRDYPVVMALTLMAALFTLSGNLAADLLYRTADPQAAPASP